ncbi:MAG: protein kinase [Pirellulales bacterium]
MSDSEKWEPDETLPPDSGSVTGGGSVPDPEATQIHASSEPGVDVTTGFDSAPSTVPDKNTTTVVTKPSVQVVAGYRLDRLLGEGGMGRVFKGVDGNGRAVAIKLLSPKLACSDEALQRFKQEGYIASQINHPHCVFVHGVDEERGVPFIAMELMTGRTLKDLVTAQGPLPYKEAVRLILQCIDGLIEAHRQGMIHRDIKPANCYLDEERNVKIGDFGLARSLVDDSELTRTGAFLGTPLFASPEQLLGQPIDERSDIYSLSATLYYLLAGRAPFESPNAAQVIAKIASSEPPRLRDEGIEIPSRLESIVRKGLERDRSRRYESFAQMRADLLPLVAGGQERASLVVRWLALVVDGTTCSALNGLFALLGYSLTGYTILSHPAAVLGFSAAVMLCYFVLQEWLFGTTLGKSLFRLRVVDAETGDRPRFKQALLRTGIYLAAFDLLKMAMLIFIEIEAESPSSVWFAIGAEANQLLAVGLLTATWWKLRRRQLTHEWLSRTATCYVQSRQVHKAAVIELPEWEPATEPAPEVPETLGRFEVIGRLPTRDGLVWLLGHDRALDRDVWIRARSRGQSPISDSRKHCKRPIRMRLIESGRDGAVEWDAFLAPNGVPIARCIEGGTVLPWSMTLSIFRQLIEERQHVGPCRFNESDWCTKRLWIDSSGRLAFAEADCHFENEPAETEGTKHKGFESLLKLIAPLGLPLKHKLRTHRGPKHKRARVPAIDQLPPYRGLQFLERAASGRVNANSCTAELACAADAAIEMTGVRRFSHSLAITLLAAPLLIAVFMFITIHNVIEVFSLHQDARQLATFAEILDNPEFTERAFSGVDAEVRSAWTGDAAKVRVQTAAERRYELLKHAYRDTGWLDHVVLEQAGINRKSVASQPAAYKLSLSGEVASDEDGRTRGGRTRAVDAIRMGNDGSAQINISPDELINPFDVDYSAEAMIKRVEQSEAGSKASTVGFPVGLFAFWFVGLFTLWTGISRGGFAQRFTRVSVVRRDGCRLGWLISMWRAAVLYLPFLLLAAAIVHFADAGVGGIFWLRLLQQCCWGLPLSYLIAAAFMPQAGVHDRLSYTVLVPR